jgi:hypothetical protein
VNLQHRITSLDVSPDNQYIAAIPFWNENYISHAEIDIYKVQSLEFVETLSKDATVPIWQVCFSSNQYLAAAYENATFNTGDTIWSTNNWSAYRSFGRNSVSCAFSPDSRYLVTGQMTYDNDWSRLFIIDIKNNKTTYSYVLNYFSGYFGNNYGDIPKTISISPDSKYIATGGSGGMYILNAKWNPTSVKENPVQITNPVIFPNPADKIVNIQFNLIKSGQVDIKIYDSASNLISTVFTGELPSGMQNFEWNAPSVSSGTYFCKIITGSFTSTIKIILNK